MSAQSPLSGSELVDEYFIENRTRLLEIAAFRDRLDRADPERAARDFRMTAFAEAIEILSGSSGNRVERIQMLLSDPDMRPLDALDRKSAVGAHNRRAGEVRS